MGRPGFPFDSEFALAEVLVNWVWSLESLEALYDCLVDTMSLEWMWGSFVDLYVLHAGCVGRQVRRFA